MVLRYQRGLFLPEAGVSDLDKASRTAKAVDVFLGLLGRLSSQGRNLSDKPTAPNYAPSAFAKEDEAKKYRMKKPELEQAMRDLFRANKLKIEPYASHHGTFQGWRRPRPIPAVGSTALEGPTPRRVGRVSTPPPACPQHVPSKAGSRYRVCPLKNRSGIGNCARQRTPFIADFFPVTSFASYSQLATGLLGRGISLRRRRCR